MKKTQEPKVPSGPAVESLDRHWHLAATTHEVSVTEFEFALLRVAEAFARWQSECLAASGAVGASGSETTLLHVIRLHERPKQLKELARLTNRDDLPNLQYALRKFVKLGLVKQGGGRNATVYSVTERGKAVTDRYAELRRQLLIECTEVISAIDSRLLESAQTLNILSGLYEQAARVVATHQR